MNEAQIIDNVFDVAGQVWDYILPFKRKKTFVDFYKTGEAYMRSFYKAFKIYHHSKRYWHISKEVGVDGVTIERFINRQIQESRKNNVTKCKEMPLVAVQSLS